MSTFKRYLVIQAMTFVIGIVGPIFLIGYFAFQPDPTLKWMYWWGLFITAADVLIALGLTNSSYVGVQAEASVPAVHHVVAAIGVLRPDDFLVELADACLGHLVDERPALRKPES